MARPPSRRSRREEPPPRRGRSSGGGSQGAPMVLVAVGAVVLIGGAALGVILTSREKPRPKETPTALGPVPVEKPVEEGPKTPVKEPPRPLTPQEKTWIDGLFRQAEPHMALFKKYAAEGWTLKEDGDESAANETWIRAKHEAQKAIEIVSEALEDYDTFPQERQDAHMRAYNDRLGQWTKELAGIPKVHVDK